MATEEYITYRKKYGRPQGLLFANSMGTVSNEMFVPGGEEFVDFIVLTDDNRQEINLSVERIEKRERMINGRMRSYHVADKLKLDVSWQMIPSRAFSTDPADIIQATSAGLFNPETDRCAIYTTDGGAAGSEMLSWHESFPGSFWVFLAYDHQTTLTDGLAKYNERLEFFFSDFKYTVKSRGPLFDYWDVSMSLEGV